MFRQVKWQNISLVLFKSKASGAPKGYSQQSKDINMSLVLVSTVAMFFFCHTPR